MTRVTSLTIPRMNKETGANEFDLGLQTVIDAWPGLSDGTRLMTCELLSHAVRSEWRTYLPSCLAVL